MNIRTLVAISMCVTACENAAAPSEVTAAVLCAHLAEASCPQGLDASCVSNLDMNSASFPSCEDARNELRRCYYIDLPADSEAELAVDPATCVLSDACANESDSLCRCERGPECDIDR